MPYTEKSILAGIVTFNPDIERLKENINSLVKQVTDIHIIDNGSDNIGLIESTVSLYKNEKISIEKYDVNKGIAKALKCIMLFAKANNYEWVLTLDQDSVIEPYLIAAYLSSANEIADANIAMFTCLIKDRNFSDLQYEIQQQEYKEVPYCITSAAFTNVVKYFETDGYDETFFIDAVDFDICYSLRKKGYKIVRVNYTGLYHEVGHGKNRNFLGKQIVVYHQKPIRIYYLARNTILMYRKHKKLFPWYTMIKKEAALFIRILVYEDKKTNKLLAFFKGICLM